MGTKRSSTDSAHQSYRSNFDSANHRPPKRSRPNAFNGGGHTSKPTSVNPIKEKIRDLTRLLERSGNLPADVRIEKERALAGYKVDLEKAEEEKRKQDMIKRYHMVRFFERQKATRALKKLQTQFDDLSPTDSKYLQVQSAIHEAHVDLNYTMYYPLAEKYQSLYPRIAEQGPETNKEIGGRGERKIGGTRPPLWGLIERSMADGTLELLRDGKLGGTMVVGREKPAPKGKPAAQGTDKRRKREGGGGGGVKLTGGAVSEDDEDEMSDGGFFEK